MPRFHRLKLLTGPFSLPPLIATCSANNFDVRADFFKFQFVSWIKQHFLANNVSDRQNIFGWKIFGDILAVEQLRVGVNKFFLADDLVQVFWA